jgi:hypothetical protein
MGVYGTIMDEFGNAKSGDALGFGRKIKQMLREGGSEGSRGIWGTCVDIILRGYAEGDMGGWLVVGWGGVTIIRIIMTMR